MIVRLQRNKRGFLEAECSDLDEWEHGDRLIRYLKREFGARVDGFVEGPDARRWFVTLRNEKLLVDQSDLGFLCFGPAKADDANGDAVVECVTERLQRVVMSEWLRMTDGPFARFAATVGRA